MFKFLLILGIIVYVIYKIGSLFFRAGAASQQFRNQQRQNFDAQPRPDPRAKKSGKGNIKGGDYVDYEEVK